MCNNTIAREQDRITVIKTAPTGGSKGPITTLELLPNCLVTCRINVSGRRAPLRLSINQIQLGKFMGVQ